MRLGSLRARFASRIDAGAVTPQGSAGLAWTFGILAVIRLWVLSGQQLVASAYLVHDDALFMNLADSILSGKWLGAYHERTLIKGPFFPLWIALTFLLGLPLQFAQNLLYVAACAVFVIAIRPAFPRTGNLTWAFVCVLLLLNPMPLLGDISWTRVLRENIYPALSMLVAATAIGLLVRADRSIATMGAWAAGVGVSVSALWLTREEGVWIVPLLFTLLAFTAVRVWARPHRWARLFLCGLPLALWAAALMGVSWLNLRYYGVFTTVEVKQPDFLAAYGALSRVKHAVEEKSYHPPPSIGYIVVPRETRYRIYAASPAFAELQRSLEGYVGRRYAGVGCTWGLVQPCNDIDAGSGFFLWSLREAAQVAGYHSSGARAAGYYRRLADEINGACAAKRLECGPERSTLAPRWHNYHLVPILRTIGRSALFAVSSFDGAWPVGGASQGDEAALNVFRELSHQTLAPAVVPPARRVKGWAFDVESTLSLSVRTDAGDLADATIRVVPRPDVFDSYLRRGMNIPAARDAGFDIVTPCITGCGLWVRRGPQPAGAQWTKALPLDGPQTKFVSGELSAVIDDNSVMSAAPPRPHRDRLAATKRSLIIAWRKLFQRLMYPLLVLSICYLPFAAALVLVKREEWIPALIIVSLLGAALSRIAVLSVIDVMSFSCAFTTHYLGPVYPFLVMFVAVSVAAFARAVRSWSWDVVWPLRRSLAAARLRQLWNQARYGVVGIRKIAGLR